MSPAEKLGRQEVLRVAREWLGTPWVHSGRIKGPKGGVDCAQFIYCVYAEAGQIDSAKYAEIAHYPRDWFLHRNEERLREVMEIFAHPISFEEIKPGDVALWKFGRTFAHTGIILEEWPNIIHADLEPGEVIQGYGNAGRLQNREVIFYSRW